MTASERQKCTSETPEKRLGKIVHISEVIAVLKVQFPILNKTAKEGRKYAN